MRLSLNEVEGGCLKAARGAGLPFGLAQEAGRAARWLALSGLAWCAPLRAALEGFEAASQVPVALTREDGWARLSGGPSALLLGPAAGDLWRSGLVEGPLRIESPDQPLFCLALLALAVEEGAGPLSVAWEGGGFSVSAETCRLSGEPPPSAPLQVTGFDSTLAEGGGELRAAAPDRLDEGLRADPGCWAALSRLAARTLVPESEESRAGAGAGAIDND